MTVVELINQLKKMPQNHEVNLYYESDIRGNTDIVYLSRANDVIISSFNELITNDDNRPINSPNVEENRYWTIQNNNFKIS